MVCVIRWLIDVHIHSGIYFFCSCHSFGRDLHMNNVHASQVEHAVSNRNKEANSIYGVFKAYSSPLYLD